MATVDELDINDAAKVQVRTLIANAAQEAGTAAVDQAKLDFRAGVAGTRRPEVFDQLKLALPRVLKASSHFGKLLD